MSVHFATAGEEVCGCKLPAREGVTCKRPLGHDGWHEDGGRHAWPTPETKRAIDLARMGRLEKE